MHDILKIYSVVSDGVENGKQSVLLFVIECRYMILRKKLMENTNSNFLQIVH